MSTPQAPAPPGGKPGVPVKKLTGPQKAALLILGLDEAVATEVLKHLDEQDMARLATHVAKFKEPPVAELDATYTDFIAKMSAPQVPTDGAAYVRKLAGLALGEDKAKALLQP